MRKETSDTATEQATPSAETLQNDWPDGVQSGNSAEAK